MVESPPDAKRGYPRSFWIYMAAVAGLVVWGVGMGAQESIVRAAVATMIAAERWGTAYGVFNVVYGIMWFAGSALLGFLYDVSVGCLVGASIVIQLAAVPLLSAVRGAGRSPAEAVLRP
jgi:MFS-type transporter involved in bile tolerance (Atg22 family)